VAAAPVAAAPVVAAPVVAAESSSQRECTRAKDSWSAAARAARAPLERLQRCLAEARPPCAAHAAELRSALAEVAASEERLRWICGEGR
jgi:hypothetical protein